MSNRFEADVRNHFGHFIQNDIKLAEKFYSALCNITWKHKGTNEEYSCSWRYSGGLIAEIRNLGEGYLDFYCAGNEGHVDLLVELLMFKIGWVPVIEERYRDMNSLILDVGNDCYQITKGLIGFYKDINTQGFQKWQDSIPQVEIFEIETSGELIEFFKDRKLSRKQELLIQQFAFEVFV